MKIATEVLIVGAGPVGLSLACFLAKYNIHFRIIDKNIQSSDENFSRALGISARTLEVLDDLGVHDEFLQQGRIVNTLGFYFGEKKISGIPFRQLPTRYPFMLTVPQYITERVLEKQLMSYGHSVDRGVNLTSILQHDDSVEYTVETKGQANSVELARFVIGADGVGSTVRALLGIDFQGEEYEEKWLLAEGRMNRDFPHDEANVMMSDSGAVAMVPMPNGKFRLAGPGASVNSLERVDINAFSAVMRSMGLLSNIKVTDLDQVVKFTVQKRTAEKYQKGRVLLIGDAAHVHSPGGGQGLNTGLQDAYALQWRLRECIVGQSNITLLSSYANERLSIGKKTVYGTDKALEMVNKKTLLFSILRRLLLPLIAHSRLGFSVVYRMSNLSVSYQEFYSDQSTEFKTSLALGDRLPRIVPKANKTGDSFDICPQGKANIIVFSGSKVSTDFHTHLETIYKSHFFQSNQIKISVVVPEGSMLLANGRFHVIYDNQMHFHQYFGSKASFVYLARPDNHIFYRQTGISIEAIDRALAKEYHWHA